MLAPSPRKEITLLIWSKLLVFITVSLNSRWGMTNIRRIGHLLHRDFLIELLPSNKTNATIGFYLVLVRKSGPYLWLYFAPCFLMVLTSWISFAVSIESVPGRLGLLLTLLLMMINMNNSLSAIIPKSDKNVSTYHLDYDQHHLYHLSFDWIIYYTCKRKIRWNQL